MTTKRQKLLTKVVEYSKLEKIAQEALSSNEEGNSLEGEKIADQVFDKLLEELGFDSFD